MPVFVDYPREALLPLRSGWRVAWGKWGVGGRRRGGRENWGWYVK